MKKILLALFFTLGIFPAVFSQDTINLKFRNQYQSEVKMLHVKIGDTEYVTDKNGNIRLASTPVGAITINGKNYDNRTYSFTDADKENTIEIHKNFSWTDLLTPMFYIIFGGIWFILFVVFAETGLFAGFFLPGDSLLFVTGIYSNDLVQSGLRIHGTGSFMNLIILGIIISLAGVLGNYVGYWFGKKSGPFLFQRKDSFFFRKKYLLQAKDFYDKHGGGAIVIARFLPIIRTFAPIVAGIVGMEKNKFAFFNVVGCVAWVFTMLFAGHYLQQFCLRTFNFDLREHLEVIVILIVLVTTAPIIIKLFFSKKPAGQENQV